MKILMVTHFTALPGEGANNRFEYLANRLIQEGFEVCNITSTFAHTTKTQRKTEPYKNENIQTVLIYEPGYPKNVCVKRIFSHLKFGQNLKKYFKTAERPDLVYCAIPSLDAGLACVSYCKKYKIPFVIDMQDLWPEAFYMALPKAMADILCFPMKLQANDIYAAADGIASVSRTYLDRALENNRKLPKTAVVFLGTSLKGFDDTIKNALCRDKRESELWIAYIGTLGTSYDIGAVLKALALVKSRGIDNIRFIVMGNGPLREQFTVAAKNLGVNAQFTGFLPYQDMVNRLNQSDIAVNPLVKGAPQSIINKVGDYAAAGLPVINTLENEEYKSLLAKYNAGIHCAPGDSEAIADAICKLYENPDIIKKMGEGSRRMAEDLFNRDKTYGEIISMIKSLLCKENTNV